MEDIRDMGKRHATEIAKLQKECNHKEKISDWTIAWGVPGASELIRFCKFCGKTVERETHMGGYTTTTAGGTWEYSVDRSDNG